MSTASGEGIVVVNPMMPSGGCTVAGRGHSGTTSGATAALALVGLALLGLALRRRRA